LEGTTREVSYFFFVCWEGMSFNFPTCVSEAKKALFTEGEESDGEVPGTSGVANLCYPRPPPTRTFSSSSSEAHYHFKCE